MPRASCLCFLGTGVFIPSSSRRVEGGGAVGLHIYEAWIANPIPVALHGESYSSEYATRGHYPVRDMPALRVVNKTHRGAVELNDSQRARTETTDIETRHPPGGDKRGDSRRELRALATEATAHTQPQGTTGTEA